MMIPIGLAGNLRLLRELGDARAERLAVEHAGQLIDHGVAAMLDVRAHQRRGEHRDAQKQRDRGDHEDRVVQNLMRVDAERDGEQDHDVDERRRRPRRAWGSAS